MDHHYASFREILAHAWQELGYAAIMADVGVELFIFADRKLSPTLDDKSLWSFCQAQGLVLLSDNRNQDSPNSLASVISTADVSEHFPVITPGNRQRAFSDRIYQLRLAESVAEVLTGIEWHRKYLDAGRIYIPLPEVSE